MQIVDLTRQIHTRSDRALSDMMQTSSVRMANCGSDERAKSAILREVEVSFVDHVSSGTSIVINLATFEYVQAGTRTSALKAFIARFGKTASGWAFEVGRPMTVGGGACPS
jgi:hypothetical protein